MRADAVVVGAGHNGLTCAAVLAQEGLDVVVVERRPVPGGAAATEELVPGFRFSTCAYAVHVLHEAVVERLALELELLPLPPRVGVLPDGSGARDGELEPEEFERWGGLWDEAARLVDPLLLGPPRTPASRPAEVSLRELLDETFVSAEAKALYAPRSFDFAADEPGGPLAYAYLETGRLRSRELRGLPRGGMGALAQEFARAAQRAGARLVLGREVGRILPGRGIELDDGSVVEARVVVSNADPVRTYRLAGRELEGAELRPAGAKLHLALRGRPDLPGEGGLIHVYPRLDWYDRCWPDHAADSILELQWPTALDPSLAPPGGHCLSAYVPFAPRGRRAGLERMLLERVAALVPGLADLLVDCVLDAPEDIERRVGLTGAQIHHLAQTPGQMYAARGGAETGVDGLFLCGAGTHPGGEISGVPGLNAARAVLESLS